MDCEERLDLVRRLFAMMTARLEDASSRAADGQGRDIGAEERVSLADQIRDAAEEVVVLAQAAKGLIEGPDRS